ncbi:hypothetical protein I6G82_12620 [Lysinibacillus macroides]|uniref:Uncharacterized protein n=1 Tax=Lysinibacillus macroides TaxID=33935 RepID=A0A0M9DLF6_9BACI|nr:hypothetical protein [Lysinibacillus macroides]KOY82806.1 hypothetical protein ADM90_05640 [Lysinibacillus macroides]QPR66146.1 hypothetical protein I6G82_12620 [Lysinibacillus macroides]
MKRIINNDRGYALVLVLIISIVFTLVFLLFLAISSNTTKQNNVVESTFQSQSIAEMGASYFQHAMTNEIVARQNRIIQEVLTQREQDIKNRIINTDEYYINSVIGDIELELKKKVIPFLNTNITIHSNSQNHFEIDSINFPSEDKMLIINFISVGYDEAKRTEIGGTVTADFSDMIDPTFNNKPEETIITGNTIADPGTNLDICSTGTRADLSNKHCQINGDISYHQNDELRFSNSTYRVSGSLNVPNMNFPSSNSTLYIVGSLNGQNLNTMTDVKLHIGGSLYVSQFNGRIVDTVIEVAGSTTLHGNLDNLNNSTMYIGGSFTMATINQITNSTIYVGGAAQIYQGVNLGRNATICVNGDLSIGNINDNSGGTSKIYARTSNSRHQAVITGNAEFEAACLGGGSPTVNPDFSPPIEYEYDYSY